MFARATTIAGSPEDVDEGIEQYRRVLSVFREISGNRGAFLLVDRGSGKALGVTLWSDEQAMAESRERANELRQQAVSETGGDIQSVEEFEVAVWEPASA
jgi:heme-degrading monooxygenase HmoA